MMTIGEVADRANVAQSTLRYYEREGLISSVRSDGGQRRYHREVLRRVAFVRAAQRVGLSLEEVRDALATLPGSRTPSAADWSRLSRQWRPLLDKRIAELERVRDGLDSCIGCGCLSLRACHLLNPDDVAAQEGPGARWLLDEDEGPSGQLPGTRLLRQGPLPGQPRQLGDQRAGRAR
jgi:MerR family transcriptional regulator, redox-sensitive transcriptional activator SoxR